MSSIRRRSLGKFAVALAALILAALTPNTNAARKTTIDGLAVSLARRLSFEKIRRVAVCPFSTNDRKHRAFALGETLSDEFIRDLASHLPHRSVLARAQLIAATRRFGILPIDVDEVPICKLAAAILDAEALVTGTLHFKDGGATVELSISAV